MKSLLGLQGTFKESEMFIHIRSQISGLQGIVLLAINVCGHVVPVFREGFSRWLCGAVPYAEARAPAPSLSGCLACLLLKQATPHGILSYCFYRERNKVLCSEESGRTRVFNPSQLLFVWVLWVEMRRKMRQYVSHLGIVGAAEESALVSRFIRKTNKGKYSLKM